MRRVLHNQLQGRYIGFFLRVVFFAGLWWSLSGGDLSSWAIGAPSVLIASYVSLLLRQPYPWSIRLTKLIPFVPFFIRQSIIAGLDVVRRAFSPSLPLDPALVEHPLQLPEGPPRYFFINTITLLPGTLSAELTGNVLSIHLLDASLLVIRDLENLERRVADMFAVNLEVALLKEEVQHD